MLHLRYYSSLSYMPERSRFITYYSDTYTRKKIDSEHPTPPNPFVRSPEEKNDEEFQPTPQDIYGLFGNAAVRAQHNLERMQSIPDLPSHIIESFERTRDRHLEEAHNRIAASALRSNPRLFTEFISSSNPEDMDVLEATLFLEVLQDLYRKGGRLSNNEFMERLKRRKEHFDALLEVFEAQVTIWRTEARKNILVAIEQGSLPLNPDLFVSRLDTLRVSFLDPLTAILSERWGDYDAYEHTARISLSCPETKRQRVFAHEVMHAMSGAVQFQETIESINAYEDEGPIIRPGKVGLSFEDQVKSAPEQSYIEGLRTSPKLSWLNEALTEISAGMATGQAKSYPKERELLSKLIEHSGVPLQTFLEAYFENYDPNREGHKLPKTKALFEALDASVFGKGFLMRLDRYITANPNRASSCIADVLDLMDQGVETLIHTVNTHHEKDTKNMRVLRKKAHTPEQKKATRATQAKTKTQRPKKTSS